MTEAIRSALDSGSVTCGIFVDFQKAFDTVNHEILLKKLGHYGFRGIINDWISYIEDDPRWGGGSNDLQMTHFSSNFL